MSLRTATNVPPALRNGRTPGGPRQQASRAV